MVFRIAKTREVLKRGGIKMGLIDVSEQCKTIALVHEFATVIFQRKFLQR